MHPKYSRPAHRRRVDGQRRSLIAVLALVASGLSVGLFNPFSAAAEPQPFGMSMVADSGRFMISGNEPGAPLGDPTTVSGTFDPATGEFSNVNFATPEVHIVQHVTQPAELDVFIDQQLIPLAPGSGSMATNGDVTLDFSFKLHVKIRASLASGDCWSEPINVQLKSTAPYDSTTGRVNLKAEGFNIPNLQTTPQCGTLITQNAGAQFAGTNNRLELTLEGDLGAALSESSTTLALSNPGPIVHGTSTKLTATVSPVEATGQVDFYAGETLLGNAPTDANGVATLTKVIDTGTHQLTARYSGNAEFAGSSSAPVELVVQAKPSFGVAFPAILTPGAAPQEFDLTVSNPSSGIDQNLRVDLSIAQTPTDTAAGGINVTPDKLALEYQDSNGDWLPVTLTQGATTYSAITGAYGGANGFALSPGTDQVVRLRMASAVGTPKRTLNITSSLKQVDAETGAAIATVSSSTSTVAIPPASRVDTGAVTLAALPGVTGETVSRGYLLAVKGTLAPAANVAGQPVNPAPIGQAELLLDGIPTPTVGFQEGVAPGGLRIPIVTQGITPAGSGGFVREFIDTQNLSVGTHTLQLRYFGDVNYREAVSNVLTFTVTPAWGKLYQCTFSPLTGGIFKGRAQVSALASLPGAVTSGTNVSFGDGEIRLGQSVYPGATGGTGFQNPRNPFGLIGPNGSFSRTQGGSMASNPPYGDQRSTYTAVTGSLVVEGEPGDVVDVTLNSITVTQTIGVPVTCEPMGAPARFGSVVVAGTKLTVSPGGTSQVGDQVTLTADVKPAFGGSVEFLSGGTSLGVVPVTAGKAVLSTGNLPGGTHQLRARHSGGSVTVNGVNLAVGSNDSNVVEKAIQYNTRTTVTSSAAAVASGPVTLTTTVATNPASSAVPTGTVQLKLDGNPLGDPLPLDATGKASQQVHLPAGPHAVTAVYDGNATFATSTSAPVTVTTGKVVTTIAVDPANGSYQGAFFKMPAMKATLSSLAGPVPGKLITFKIGAATACTATTNAAGVATCAGQVNALIALLQGQYSAVWAGDATATAATGKGAILR